jgi:flagellar basal body P-ring protein FlgI
VRLADVDAANQILSAQVADARIEYAGDGSVAQRARRLAVEILQLHQPVLRTPMRIPSFLAALVALASTMMAPVAHAERVRDIGTFSGVRSNQLTGYGIVVGLDGTGDDTLDYTTQAMKGVSGRMGLQLPTGINPGLKNAAAVMVTADLPAFSKPGQRIDITVSAIGKAKSLRGGALILTPLYGADGQIYAMAQGNLAVGGLGVAARDGSQVSVNIPTTGRIAEGPRSNARSTPASKGRPCCATTSTMPIS